MPFAENSSPDFDEQRVRREDDDARQRDVAPIGMNDERCVPVVPPLPRERAPDRNEDDDRDRDLRDEPALISASWR